MPRVSKISTCFSAHHSMSRSTWATETSCLTRTTSTTVKPLFSSDRTPIAEISFSVRYAIHCKCQNARGVIRIFMVHLHFMRFNRTVFRRKTPLLHHLVALE
jgi:hypothetical protein